MHKLSLIGSFAILVTAAFSSVADEKFDPEHFVQTQCARCHDHSVYTREDRRVRSLEGLRKQVEVCDRMVETKLFDEEIEAIVSYLNDNYYKFSR